MRNLLFILLSFIVFSSCKEKKPNIILNYVLWTEVLFWPFPLGLCTWPLLMERLMNNVIYHLMPKKEIM